MRHQCLRSLGHRIGHMLICIPILTCSCLNRINAVMCLLAAMASNSSLSSLTELLVACMSSRSLRNAGISTESKVLCCSLNASLIPLAIASISSLEMVEFLNFFFIGDCPISLFRSPLTVEALMMSPMQNGSKFTDRIIKYLTKSAERKTTPASKSKGHVISSSEQS